MNTPFLRPLGSGDWLQSKHNDNSCYTIDDNILIDCNSALVMNLLHCDIEPTSIDTIFFTHMHTDHMLGLCAFAQMWKIKRHDLGGLTLIGPAATIRTAVMQALYFTFCRKPDATEEELMQAIGHLPNIVEVEGEGRLETDDYRVYYTDSDHSVPGLCYRFDHKATGKRLGISGDTKMLTKFADFWRLCDLLVYECSYGAGPLDENNEKCRHSSAREAAQVCIDCGARTLMLTHTERPKREAALEEAKRRLEIPVLWALPFETFAI